MNTVLQSLISRYPDLSNCADDISRAFELLKMSFRNGGKLLVCGNGGSASDSEHIVGELMKGFQAKRPISAASLDRLTQKDPELGAYLGKNLQGALPAVALSSHTALMTAIANDVSADMVFAQQVYGLGREGDVLLGISTSGNSANVINAIYVADVFGLNTIGLTGETGGKMMNLCTVTIRAPSSDTAQIQERHLPIYHALCIMLEQEFFDDSHSGRH